MDELNNKFECKNHWMQKLQFLGSS